MSMSDMATTLPHLAEIFYGSTPAAIKDRLPLAKPPASQAIVLIQRSACRYSLICTCPWTWMSCFGAIRFSSFSMRKRFFTSSRVFSIFRGSMSTPLHHASKSSNSLRPMRLQRVTPLGSVSIVCADD
jgi:hypothetical protein